MNLFDFDQALPDALADLTPEAWALVLRVLNLPDADRAKAIGELHQRSGGGACIPAPCLYLATTSPRAMAGGDT